MQQGVKKYFYPAVLSFLQREELSRPLLTPTLQDGGELQCLYSPLSEVSWELLWKGSQDLK